MKAEELMIGDWVFLDGVPSRVELIEANPQTVYVKNERLGIRVDMEDVDPIPLTDEILEANGFEYFHRNYASLSREHPFLLRMDKWPDENGLGGVWTICDIIGIRFVHQLQHALRLCGIEKEITIR